MIRHAFLIFILVILMLPSCVNAQESNSYVTVVNPIRGRSMWENIDYLKDQVELILARHIAATWLLQYETLQDNEVVTVIKTLPGNQEVGLFLEIDQSLSDAANVPYLIGQGDWARPDKVLLSGYTLPERKRLIDMEFETYKKVYGYYPKSVGAWYIDTFSQNYLVDTYKVSSFLQVSDQYQTDKYGIWGTSWGTPYFPSQFNSLISGQTPDYTLNAVSIQWAPRDPIRGYGLNVVASTYSVQANDYLSHNLTTLYFDYLKDIYLTGEGGIHQLTVGIEVGQEGVGFRDEFIRQLDSLKSSSNIRMVTTYEFARIFRQFSDKHTPNFLISGSDYTDKTKEVYWYTTPNYRAGLIRDGNTFILQDLRIYDEDFTFSDMAAKDIGLVLERYIPACADRLLDQNEKILVADVVSVQAEDNNHVPRLKIVDKNNNIHILDLFTDSIILDGKPLITMNSPKSLMAKLRNFLVKFLLTRAERQTAEFFGGIRISKFGNVSYLGWMASPDNIIGFSSQPPFMGKFSFPFQVLSRFKTIPEINYSARLFAYLVNRVSKCTITI